MKAVFIASLTNTSASGRQRLWAMHACGVETIVINKDDWAPKWLKSMLINKLKISKLLTNKKLAKEILRIVTSTNPQIVWIEWCKEIPKITLDQLKLLPNKPLLISFIDDNPWGKRISDVWMWQEYFKNIPLFDWHVVKRESDIANLKKYGGNNCYIWEGGIFSPLFRMPTEDIVIKYPVSFVGTCFDGREKLIGYLLDNNIPIHVFGNRWLERTNLPKKYPANFHNAVEGQAYVDVIWSSQICLGLVSDSNEDQWTMRTYEVPGCGKPLLAVATNVHKILFDEFSETLLFNSYEDCVQKINFLLSNIEVTNEIGEQLSNKLIASNFTLSNCMNKCLKEILNTGK